MGVWERIFILISRIPHATWLLIGMILLILLHTFTPRNHWISVWLAIKAHLSLVILVVIFGFILVSLLWTIGQRIDIWAFKDLNIDGHRAHWLDRIMLGCTQIGNGLFIFIVVLFFFLRSKHLLAYELAAGALTLGLVVEFIKALIYRTRPYIKLKNIRIVGSKAMGHSFPSGHTSQTFLITTLILHYYHVGVIVWLLLYTIASLVGITRIYLGMHYPRDVLAGAMLGTAWGLLGVIVNTHLGGNI